MLRISKKVSERLTKGTRSFQKVLEGARARDVNESDTVTIIADILDRVFGFDKYTEVTSEQAIRGTYCDLAVKLDGTIQYLIEVKAIGLSLKENHLRQAVNYGANQGIPWVVLTNGINWDIYRVLFERPVGHELVCSWDFLELNPRKAEDHNKLFLLCKEGLKKAAIQQFHEHVQTVNRFVVSAIIQTDPVLGVIRREVRRLSPETKVSIEEIRGLLPEVLKREVFEGDEATTAKKRVQRAATKAIRKRKPKPKTEPSTQEAVEESQKALAVIQNED